MGEAGLRFYAAGLQPNHENPMARKHVAAWANSEQREAIARRMFRIRFEDGEVDSDTVPQLRMSNPGATNLLRPPSHRRPDACHDSGAVEMPVA